MNEAVSVLFVIAMLFVAFLVLKSILKWRFCVLCLSVSATWVVLLVLYWLGKFNQPLIIGVLMGQSVTGIYSLLEKKTKERFHVFRLPLLLTLTLVAFLALEVHLEAVSAIALLSILWATLFLLYWYRQNSKIKVVVDNIIACCKDW